MRIKDWLVLGSIVWSLVCALGEQRPAPSGQHPETSLVLTPQKYKHIPR